MKRMAMATAMLVGLAVLGAHAQTAAQLQGRWYLTAHQTTVVGGGGSETHRPGDELWWNDYFIEFNANGTFRELNFWNPGFTASGTWTLSGNTVTLNLNVQDRGDFEFVRQRTLRLGSDGATLTMDYRRPQWTYVATYRRAGR